MPPDPILVIGQSGQLAQALAQSDRVIRIGRDQLDLSWASERIILTLEAIIARHKPLCGVINAAAYTAVDAAENDRETAYTVNATALSAIASVCASANLPLVHISTDYVFNGQATTPYLPDAPTDPVNIYGMTKQAGEKLIIESGVTHAILRTSWVFDGINANFVTTMLRLAKDHDTLKVVNDQWGRPTYTADLATAAFIALNGIRHGKPSGIYHVSNTGPVISWAEFARAIFKRDQQAITVHNIPSSDYPTIAARPAYSALDTTTFERVFDHSLPDWQDALERALNRRKAIVQAGKDKV